MSKKECDSCNQQEICKVMRKGVKKFMRNCFTCRHYDTCDAIQNKINPHTEWNTKCCHCDAKFYLNNIEDIPKKTIIECPCCGSNAWGW